MEKENISLKIEVIMRENGRITWWMVKVFYTTQMERLNTKVNGKKISLMDGENYILYKNKESN